MSDPSTATVDAAVTATARRLRHRRAARFAHRHAAPASLALAGVWLAWSRSDFEVLPASVVIAMLLAPWLGVARELLRPTSPAQVAARIDRHYGWHDALRHSLELREHPPGSASVGFAELLHQHAEALAARVVPRDVLGPGRWHFQGRHALACLLAAIGAWAPIPGRAPPRARPPASSTEHPPANPRRIPEADLLREDLRTLGGADEVARLANATEEVFAQLEQGLVDRAAALDTLDALARELNRAEEAFSAGLQDDPAALSALLAELAETWQRHEATKDLARAVRDRDPEAADAALRRAREKAEEKLEHARELERSMRAAKKRMDEAASRQDAAARAADREERRLRKRRPRQDGAQAGSAAQEQRERTLERLRREQERARASAKRARELADAARNAAGQRGGTNGAASNSAKKALREAMRSSKQQQRLQRMKQSVKEAQKILRRMGKSGKSGKSRRQQMRKFSKRADGKGGKPGESSLLIESELDASKSSQSAVMENPGDGQGRGQRGAPILREDGSAGAGGSGAGGAAGSQSAAAKDAAARRAAAVQVAAREGKGASRAEVLRSSSQSGFATEAYRDVYRDYRDFAQSVLDEATLGAEERNRVHRYFQLIQPRHAPTTAPNDNP